MDTKTISKRTKQAVAIGLCASLVGGVAAPVLSTANVAHAAVAPKPQPNTINSHIIQFKDENLKKAILFELHNQNLIDYSVDNITKGDALKLKILDLSYQGMKSIKSIEGLEFFKNLKTLAFYDNQVSDLTPLAGLSKLTKLNFAYNDHISDLTPLASLTGLTSLDLRYNHISDLTPLSGLTKLTDLYLDDNQITNITPLASLTKLTKLALSSNHISDFTPLASLTGLTKIYAKDQTITLHPKSSKVDVAKEIKGFGNVVFGSDANIVNGVLTLKDGMENPYTVKAKDGEKYSATVKIDFSQTKKETIIHFKDENLKNAILSKMKRQNLIDEAAQDITKDDALKVKELGVHNKSITSIEGLENFKNLTELNLYENRISDIKPLAALTNLETLALDHNNISDLTPLAGLSKLTYLYLHNNHLSDIKPLTNLTKLTVLNLANNQVSDLTPLAGLPKLTGLNLNDNQIADITPLAGLSNLMGIHLNSNHLSDLTPLKGLTKLETFAATEQTINLQPTTPTVDLKKEIKGFGNVTFDPDDNVANGVLTYKEGMINPYQVKVSEKNGKHEYSGTVNVDFSNTNKGTETQTGDISSSLERYLGAYNQVIVTDKYKNADDNLKQAYDTAIGDGQKVYDKLSSTSDEVARAINNIQQAFHALNGDAKANAAASQLQNRIQQLEQELEQAKQQGTADKSKIDELTGKISTLNSQLEQLRKDNAKSDEQKQQEINKLNGQIEDLGIQIERLTRRNTMLKGQVTRLQEQLGKLQGQLQSAQQQGVADKATIERLSGQVASLSSQLDALKADKTKSEQEKQKEIERLSGQVRDLTSQVSTLTSEKRTLQQQLDAATGKVSALTSELEQLKAAKKQADEKNEQTIAGLNAQVAQLTKDKQGLQDQINTKQTEINKLQGQIQALKDDHSKSDTEKLKKIEQLTTQLATLTQEKQDLQGKLDADNEKISTLTQQLQQAQSRADADTKQLQELTHALQQAKQQLEQLKSDKTKSDEQKQQEIDTLNAKIAELEKKVQTCSAQAVGGAIVAPLVNEKPTFDIEKYKREHNYMLSGIATHTYQTTPDTFTSDVHAALQQLAPMAASTNAAAQATAQHTDESERAQAEQKADTSSKQEADKTKLDQNKFPQTGDNSLLTLLSTFAGALVLVLGCFARKKSSKANKR